MMTNQSGRDPIEGSVRVADGTGAVHLEVRLDTDIVDVWSALTEPRRLAEWLGEVDGDLRPGGRFHGRFLASGWDGTGLVEACEPPNRFRVRTQAPDEPDELVTEVTLAADGERTLLVVEEGGMPADQVAAYGAGVQIHVEDLADHIAGRSRSEAENRWNEILPTYQTLAASESSPSS